MRLSNTTKKLIEIKNHIDQDAGIDISIKSRQRSIVLYRVLFYKLALELTDESLQKIGEILNRDHSTVLHSRNKNFEYMMSLETYRNLYKKYMELYKLPVIDLAEEENIEITQLRNQVKNQHEIIEDLEKIINNIGLTKNEKEYRKLSTEQQIDYDERVNLFLKSLTWKKQNQMGDIFNCSNNVIDARGIL